MATGAKLFTGYNDWFPIPDLSPSAPHGFSWDMGPRGLQDPGAPQKLREGAFTNTQPSDMPIPGPDVGGRVRSYFEDYYNRIYVQPALIDFGAITSDSTVTVRIWNAFYRNAVNLTAIDFDVAAGLRVEGSALPNNLAPLEETTYSVVATAEGPALLDALIDFVFDLPLTLSVAVSGSRVRLLGVPPAWPPTGQSYQLTYSYKTTISQSRSGREQRIATRTSPRKRLSYKAHVHQDSFRRLKDLMWYWQHRAFAVPELPRFVKSTFQMLPGEDAMTLASIPSWLVTGLQVILSSKGSEDIRVVESIAGNVVTFKTQSSQTWPVGTKLYPGLTGNLDTRISAPRLTNAVATVNVLFDVTPLSEPNIAPPAAPATFNGRELFLTKPNWANPVDGTFGHAVDEVDYERGPVARMIPVKFGSDTRKATYLARDVVQADLLLDMFRRMKGRQGEFYMPTWEYDFKPKITAPAGTQSFRVAGQDFATFYKDSTVHKAMFVQMRSGVVQVRKVISVLPVTDGAGTDSLITLDSTWTEDVSESSIVMAGWMPVWRFVSDDLTFEWVTSAVANVQMTMITLEDLPVENP